MTTPPFRSSPESTRAPAAASKAPLVPSSNGSQEILLVDDEPAFRNLLVDRLRHEGYIVHEAGDGRAALHHLATHRVGLVISDVCMPDFDGIELLTELRRQRPQPAIIMMSGGMTTSTSGSMAGNSKLFLNVAHALGAHRTLAKPFPLEELFAIVREMIGRAI